MQRKKSPRTDLSSRKPPESASSLTSFFDSVRTFNENLRLAAQKAGKKQASRVSKGKVESEDSLIDLLESVRKARENRGGQERRRGVTLTNQGATPVLITQGQEESSLCPGQSLTVIPGVGAGKPVFADAPTIPTRFLFLELLNKEKHSGAVEVDLSAFNPVLAESMTVVITSKNAPNSVFREIRGKAKVEIPPEETMAIVGIGFNMNPIFIPGMVDRGE